jgi:hypothetical protein
MFLNITDGRLLNQYYRPEKPLYDAVKGIRSVARGNHANPSEPYLFSQFHCLQDISSSIIGKDVNMTSPQMYRNTYFYLLLILKSPNDRIQNIPSLSQILAECDFDGPLMSEENTLAILDIVDPYHTLSPTLSTHFAECNLRLLEAVYSEIRQLYRESESQSPPLKISPFSLSSAVKNIKSNGDEIGAEFDIASHHPKLNHRRFFFLCLEFVRQWALSVNSYFSAIINSDPNDPQLLKSFHAHTFFHWYLHQFMDQLYESTNDDLDSEILMVVVSTLTEISVALNDFGNPRRVFLFYTASYYAKLLATGIFRPRQPSIVSAVSTLLEALRNFKAHLGDGVMSFEQTLEIPSFSDKKWWDFLQLPEEKPTSVYAPNSEKMGGRFPNLSSLSLASRKSKAQEADSDYVPAFGALPTPYAKGNDSE